MPDLNAHRVTPAKQDVGKIETGQWGGGMAAPICKNQYIPTD